MKLRDMAQELGLENLTPELSAEAAAEVAAGCASDLLSNVLANAPKGGVLVTIQVHLNVVAVAVHAELAAVIFASDRAPEEVVRRKGVEERIVLYKSHESAFDIVGKLYAMGLRGPNA